MRNTWSIDSISPTKVD